MRSDILVLYVCAFVKQNAQGWEASVWAQHLHSMALAPLEDGHKSDARGNMFQKQQATLQDVHPFAWSFPPAHDDARLGHDSQAVTGDD